MKYKITVNEQTYEVDIEDINTRPVIAHVDGVRFEVMPGNTEQVETKKEAGNPSDKPTFKAASPVSFSPNPAISGNAILAPLPGTVVEIFVKPGDQVEAGQVVVIIEAMKMKNSIRSTFSGRVHEVLVSTGQSVAHKQALVKFAELGEASWI